ncbi:MAG: LuxR C-terminal-related transcriptional regulator [Mangrovibacterium sp.]|nr:LuxR C-terminal-related transcriptional regulator [Mangrovibacterium sp.]
MDKCRINIALAEPSQIVCEGLINILLKTGTHNRVFRFDNLDEILSAIPSQQLDMAIINPVFIHGNIPDFIQKRNAVQLAAWVGILYTLPEREVLPLFDATIHITDSPVQIADTIHQLVLNHCHCPGYPQNENLTTREIDILRQITLGLSNKEIADKLNISIHTVISHRKNIICKTGIKSQAGLTIYAISNKIISLENFPG